MTRTAITGQSWGADEGANAVADLLEDAGEPVPAETLRRIPGLSAKGLSLALAELRKQGYCFGRAPGGCIALKSAPDSLLPRLVTRGLATSVVGRNAVGYRSTPSTNTIAMQMAAAGCPDGLVVAAEGQSSGRGRLGRVWSSRHGRDILFSVVLRPPIAPSEVPALAFLGAVASLVAVRAMHGMQAVLKWPNDVMVRGRKLAGVLAEAASGRSRPRYVVVGTGINVNSLAREFPAQFRRSLTTVRAVTGKRVARLALLRRILEEMDRRYGRIRATGSTAELVREWSSLSPMVGRIIRLGQGDGFLEGTVTGFDEGGALLIRTAAGTVERCLAGDVTILK
jgi:BirA family biotin operon repressor/biotin-[acetyl-CoA-carboxylase] ligase